MFATRSYILKATSKSLHDGNRELKGSDTTPRTMPAIENIRSFGWRPDSYQDSRTVDGATTAKEQETRKNAKSKKGVKSAGAKALETDQKTRPQLLRRDLSSDLLPNTTLTPEVSSPPPRSRPVPVPTKPNGSRTSSPRSPTSTGTPTSSRRGSVNSTSQTKIQHDPNSTAPAVAALLAMTSIPKRRSFPKPRPRSSTTSRKMSAQELMEEWKLEDVVVESMPDSPSPNMELLLSPPDEEEELLSGSSRGDLEERQLRERSASTDSVPSLASDDGTPPSFSLGSPPSSIFRRQANEKRERCSSPKSVDATSDHPLNPQTESEPDAAEDDIPSPLPTKFSKFSSSATPPKPCRSKSSPAVQHNLVVDKQKQNRSLSTSILKSNLTASLAAFRAAARSVSNFAGPSIPPDDYLSRNFFTVPYTAERRPKPIHGVPTPELRRYLNPPHPTVKGGPMYDFHLHGSHVDHTDLEAIAAAAAAAAHLQPSLSASDGGLLGQKHSPTLLSTYPAYTSTQTGEPITAIPLETYHSNARDHGRDRSGVHSRKTSKASESIVPTEAGPMQAQRAREPRENSDFLRVCVLEMGMRRAGKLEPGAPGRARVWLPPRAPPAFVAGSSVPSPRSKGRKHGGSSVNRRWEGMTVEY